MLESMMPTVAQEQTPNVQISFRQIKKRPRNAPIESVLCKGMTRTDNGPALRSLPSNFLALQTNANSGELSMSRAIRQKPARCPQTRNAETCLKVPSLDWIRISP